MIRLLALAAILGGAAAQDITDNQCFVRVCFGHRELDPLGRCGCYKQGLVLLSVMFVHEGRRASLGHGCGIHLHMHST